MKGILPWKTPKGSGQFLYSFKSRVRFRRITYGPKLGLLMMVMTMFAQWVLGSKEHINLNLKKYKDLELYGKTYWKYKLGNLERNVAMCITSLKKIHDCHKSIPNKPFKM